MYVFGGQDDDNNKLEDLWSFNLTTKTWNQIHYKTSEDFSVGRSGQTAVDYGSKMFIFGGILEVTKELNDLVGFDYKTQTFSIINPNGDGDSPYYSRFEEPSLHPPVKH